MTKGIFITDTTFDESTGGGNVAYHEYEALKYVCADTDIISGKNIPTEFRLNDDPFAKDFYASTHIQKTDYDIASINGHPFGRTIRRLKHFNPDIKIVCCTPAHDIEKSRDEHYRLGLDYDKMYPHMVNPKLFQKYISQNMMADLIVCPSVLSMNYIIKMWMPKARIIVIPHGCYPPKNLPKIEMNADNMRYAYIGVAGPDKGVMNLLDTWRASFNDNSNTMLIFFGKAWNSLKHQRTGNIFFYGGYKDFAEIAPFFDVGVFPSVTEGFNIPVLECMSWGKPVIVSNGAGVSELVKDSGIVYELDRPNGLVEAMLFYMNNVANAITMGYTAAEIAKEYTWDKVEKSMELAYRSVL